jgi:pyridoxine 5-phosphate synthase
LCRSSPASAQVRAVGPRTRQKARCLRRSHACAPRTSEFPIHWAANAGADRIELYTEPYARAFERGPQAAGESFARYAQAAELAHGLGLGINAGHDLDLENLVLFRKLPHLDEVSIGHALISRALFAGLGTVCREYLDLLAKSSWPALLEHSTR